MEPFSIAGGVVGLLGTSVKVASVLNELYRDVATVNLRINGLKETVQGFITILSMMKDTLEQEEIKASLGTTGHVNNHWTHISITIKDGQKTLLTLQKLLEKINKSTSLMDSVRKNVRLQNVAQEILVYQSSIQQYNDTLQLSLQTITVWNQSTLQQSTDKIIPKLDGLEQKVRQLAFTFNRSMTNLRAVIDAKGNENQPKRNEAIERLQTLQNLENCVKSAATMVSDVSTSLNNSDHGRSEFGDIFPPEESETMRRFRNANKTRDKDEDAGPSNYPRRTSTGVMLGVVSEDDESDSYDSETELEVEKFQAVLETGKRMFDEGEYGAAEDRFLSCLKILERVRTEGATVSWTRMSVSKPEIIRLLYVVYLSEERLEDAQSLLMEAIGSDTKLVSEMASLAQAFFDCEDYARAHICGDRALRAYKKLRQVGSPEDRKVLQLLIDICKAQGNQDDQIAFEDLLSQRQTTLPRQRPISRNRSITLSSAYGESSATGAMVEPVAQGPRMKSSSLLSPFEETRSQHPSSPGLLSVSSASPTRIPFEDQLSPLSLPSSELTESLSSDSGGKSRATSGFFTPRSSVATTLESKSPLPQPESGTYFDSPESSGKAYPWPYRTKNRTSPKPALGGGRDLNFEQEVDQIFNVTDHQQHASFDSTSFSFGPRSVEAKDKELQDEILPVVPARPAIRSDAGSEKVTSTARSEKEIEIGSSSTHSRKSSTTLPSPGLQIRTATNLSAIPSSKKLYKKVVVVGDSKCGKTPLLSLIVRGIFLEHTNHTGWNVETMDIEAQGLRLDLVIWEIGGHDKQGLSRLGSSPPPDAFLICFSIDAPRSLAAVRDVWQKDVKKYGKKAPSILVGLKSDLRSDSSTIADLRRRGESPCTIEQGQEVAESIKATQYLECSAKTGEGVHEVLDAVTHLTIRKNLEKIEERMKKDQGQERKSSGTNRFKNMLKRGLS